MAAPMKYRTFSAIRSLLARNPGYNGFRNLRNSSTGQDEHNQVEKMEQWKVTMARDESMIICWHPDKDFPYEHTKDLPSTSPVDLEMADSIMKKEHYHSYLSRFRKEGPSKHELANIFFTSKHMWYPNSQKRHKKPYPPRDRPGL